MLSSKKQLLRPVSIRHEALLSSLREFGSGHSVSAVSGVLKWRQ